jgi:hypothetical protein
MNWVSITARGLATIICVCLLLYCAESLFPLGSLLVFLLVLSVGITWAIISMLKDDDVLTNMFDD